MDELRAELEAARADAEAAEREADNAKRTMIKLEKEPTAKGVLIVPEWPTQPWWPKLQNLQGRRLKLPPPKFAVSAFHIACVEPRLHPALRLQAIVFGNGI